MSRQACQGMHDKRGKTRETWQKMHDKCSKTQVAWQDRQIKTSMVSGTVCKRQTWFAKDRLGLQNTDIVCKRQPWLAKKPPQKTDFAKGRHDNDKDSCSAKDTYKWTTEVTWSSFALSSRTLSSYGRESNTAWGQNWKKQVFNINGISSDTWRCYCWGLGPYWTWVLQDVCTSYDLNVLNNPQEIRSVAFSDRWNFKVIKLIRTQDSKHLSDYRLDLWVNFLVINGIIYHF